MNKLLTLALLAIVGTGVSTIATQQAQKAHAITTPVVNQIQHGSVSQKDNQDPKNSVESSKGTLETESKGSVGEKIGEASEAGGVEKKGTETDDPGGHQDTQGANIDQQGGSIN